MGWILWHINPCRLVNAKSSLYIYIYWIYRIWFGWVLWHINHCMLFNAKSSLYIYIKYIEFGLVGIYDISTIVGYLMPKPLYIYIYIYIYIKYIWFGWVRFYCISKSSVRASGAWHHSHPLVNFLFWHLWTTHPPRARALTPALKFAPNPWAEPKGSQPN